MARQILAYDSSCTICSETARSVEKAALGKLEVAPLNSPEVLGFFATLGGTYGNRPALISVNENKVRVAEGLQLGRALLFHLGAFRTYGVLQALGEGRIGSAPERTIARRGFLAASAGAVAAFGVLTAGPASAAPTNPLLPSDGGWLAKESIQGSADIGEKEARDIAEDFLLSPLGEKFRDVGGMAVLEVAEVQGVRHETSSGGFEAISVQDEQTTLLIYRKANGDDVTVSASLLGAAGIDEHGEVQVAQLLATTARGEVEVVPTELHDDGGYTLLASCNQTACKKQGRCYSCSCNSMDLKCVVGICGSCAFSCKNQWFCLACVATRCPAALHWGNKCCRTATCKYEASHTC